jgi:hypothetical protein
MVLRCVFDLSSMQKERSLFLAGVSIGCGLCESDRGPIVISFICEGCVIFSISSKLLLAGIRVG